MGRAGTSAGQPKMGCTKTQLLALLQYIIEECEISQSKQECIETLKQIEQKVRKNAWSEIVRELL